MPFGRQLKFAASSSVVGIARGPFGVGGELNLAPAFLMESICSPKVLRTAASNSASNLEHTAAAAWLYWLDAAVLQIRRTKNYGRRTRLLP
jgi:hypothetical protein